MSCLVTKGYTKDCKESMGGIKNLYIGNYADFLSGITFDGVTGQIDALPTATVYRFEAPKNVANFSEVATGDEANGTLFYAQTISSQLWKMEQDKANQLHAAAKGNPVIFYEDFNGNIFMMGRENGTDFRFTSQSGTAKGDLNGYILSATAEEATPAEQLEAYTTVPFDNFAGITVTPGALS